MKDRFLKKSEFSLVGNRIFEACPEARTEIARLRARILAIVVEGLLINLILSKKTSCCKIK